jgi:ABC-type multidrug transport system fused ATPase/permease subunit
MYASTPPTAAWLARQIFGQNQTSLKLWELGRPALTLSAVLMGMYSIAVLTEPLLVRELIRSIQAQTTEGAYYSVSLFFIAAIGAICNQMHLHLAYRTGQRLRATAITAIYRKAMSLSNVQRQALETGKMTNLISNDAQKLYELMQLVNLLWSAPAQVCFSVYFLLKLLGVSSLAGILTLILMVPATKSIAKSLRRLRQDHMPLLDERVRLCTDVLQGIRVAKFFSWEAPFINTILTARRKEEGYIRRELTLWALTIVCSISAPVVAMVATFTAYSLSGQVLNAPDVFAALLFFNILKFPINYLGMVLAMASQTFIALQRINAFLDLPSSTTFTIESARGDGRGGAAEQDGDGNRGAGHVHVHSATFVKGQPEEGSCFRLRNVNMTVKSGEVMAVCGLVGAGKTTLIEGILREVELESGTPGAEVSLVGSVAYAAQTPFILNASVRENITFGLPWDEALYRKVLDCCALVPDLMQLSDGDQTLIGERGVTLSGGQKQRVSIARVAYSQPDVALFDDILSALDAHTGKYVFAKLLGKGEGLLRNSAVVLVTHAVQYLGQTDAVMVIHDGECAFTGTFDELRGVAGNMEASEKEVAGADTKKTKGGAADEAESTDSRSAFSLNEMLTSISSSTQESAAGASSQEDSTLDVAGAVPGEGALPGEPWGGGTDAKNPLPCAQTLVLGKETGSLMQEEERAVGTLGFEVVKGYFYAQGGWWWGSIMFVFLLFERITYISVDWVLVKWCAANDRPLLVWGMEWPQAFPKRDDGANFYITLYGVIALLNCFFVLARTQWFGVGGSNAACNLFRKLVKTVFYVPMVFFDTQPLGRVVNRFAFDTEQIDYQLVLKLNNTMASAAWMVSAIAVMVAINPLVLLVLLPVMMLFYKLQQYYRHSSVELQRLDSSSRSPIQAHFSETLNGAPTIRAFGQTGRFIRLMDGCVDKNGEALLAFTGCSRWLGARLDLLGAVVKLGVALLCWTMRKELDGGFVGMAMIWAHNFTVSLNFFTIFSTEAEAHLTSVERVLQYSRLPIEEGFYGDADGQTKLTSPKSGVKSKVVETSGAAVKRMTRFVTPPADWPNKGTVEFKNVSMRYRAGLDLVLRGLSMRVEGGSRIGIVGRTGAGKSSLAVALFRLVEPCDGDILIDGVSLRSLRLTDVRGRAICIIPQDATIFAGEFRRNLDPFDEHTDEELWAVLEQVRMKQLLLQQSIGSDSDNDSDGSNGASKAIEHPLLRRVEDGGANFSAGQRQLICLARALLRKPRVLVLDEATASVDHATDQFIQHTIRDSFASSTLLTIAHRLHTVMDFDKILVLQNGQVAEYDKPHALLQDPQSQLSLLAASAGKGAEVHLRQLAADAASGSCGPS